ncbi:MAG TPA: VOC family protein [Polyangiaceae bacterium]|nr:VOC family protein [Polyangiaceae bacterium]
MIQIDHIGIPARDARASAQRLAEILGAAAPTTDGADDDMYRVEVGQGAFVLFNPAQQIDLVHVAFRVDEARFEAIVARLRRAGVAFGNEPDDPRNGKTDDPLGGRARIYFSDENRHLFEVTC